MAPIEEPLHVLVVDDEPDLLDTMSVILQMEGFRVSTAHDGLDAASRLSSSRQPEPLDILVTDIEMPRLSGKDLIDKVRATGGDSGILVISAYGTKALVADLLKKGVDDYIDKPFSMDDLVKRVKALAGKVQARRSQRQRLSAVIEDRDARLKQLQAQLASSDEYRTLGKIAGGVAHDFNNALCAAVGFAEMGIRAIETEAPDKALQSAREYLELILSSGKMAQRTVAKLLAFGRGEAAVHVPVDLHRVVHETVRLLRAAVRSGMIIETKLADRPPYVRGDYALLSNALMNLLLNARDAMPGGGVVTVSTAFIGDDDTAAGDRGVRHVELRVRDSGMGMSEEVKNKAFEPFFTTKGSAGSGLGLASVLSTVNAHGGTIEVRSQMGAGTELRMTFPLCEPGPADGGSGTSG